jgi:hypothetical protein
MFGFADTKDLGETSPILIAIFTCCWTMGAVSMYMQAKEIRA